MVGEYQNLQSLKEGLILLCESVLETRRITHLHDSDLFTTPLMELTHIEHCLVTWKMSILLEKKNLHILFPQKDFNG